MTPYMSFVIAARNDNYGGNFLSRIQVFVTSLLTLWNKYGLNAELIIVEWNPLKNRPHLKDVISWPNCLKANTVRIIEVPNEIHTRLPNSDRMPMFEYIAKNVGIRRARGKYVLATNPDLLFSEELVLFLASQCLTKNNFYRIDRYDINEPLPLNIPVEEQLEFCAHHVHRIATIDGTIPAMKFLHSGLTTIFIGADSSSFSKRRLHTNAAGDFFLMSKQNWEEIRGYPELKTHSFIDGYACFQAAALGLQQVVLKGCLRIYHLEHDRSDHNRRPLTDYRQYLEHGKKMLELRRPEMLNGKDWGLGSEQLSELWIIQ